MGRFWTAWGGIFFISFFSVTAAAFVAADFGSSGVGDVWKAGNSGGSNNGNKIGGKMRQKVGRNS